MTRAEPRLIDADRRTWSSFGLSFGVVLFVGVTSSLAAPIGLIAQGVHQLDTAMVAPVPWPRAFDVVPLVSLVLLATVFLGVGIGVLVCCTPHGRIAVAHRLQVLVIFASLSLLGWSLNAIVFALPFLGGGGTLTGLSRSTSTSVIAGSSTLAILLGVGGAAGLALSSRIAETARERIFGLDSRHCWACGYRLESARCAECGKPSDWTPRAPTGGGLASDVDGQMDPSAEDR